jgi:hypothetical protein
MYARKFANCSDTFGRAVLWRQPLAIPTTQTPPPARFDRLAVGHKSGHPRPSNPSMRGKLCESGSAVGKRTGGRRLAEPTCADEPLRSARSLLGL